MVAHLSTSTLLPEEPILYNSSLCEFMAVQRNNRFATAQRKPKLTKLIDTIDFLIAETFPLLDRPSCATWIVPMILYSQAHSSFRSCYTLLLGGALVPGSAVLRLVVETTKHAHTILRYPDSLATWEKMSGTGAKKEKQRSKSKFDKFTENLRTQHDPYLAELDIQYA
jgi:hypothetical protein